MTGFSLDQGDSTLNKQTIEQKIKDDRKTRIYDTGRDKPVLDVTLGSDHSRFRNKTDDDSISEEERKVKLLEDLTIERNALHQRVIEINDKLNSGTITDDDELNLVNLQAFAMRSYNFALSARIAKLKKSISTVCQ